MSNTKNLSRIAPLTLPVAFGYFPLGIVFGLLCTQNNLEWWWPSLIGLLVYAGAAQFMTIGLISLGASFSEILSSVLFLNLRHFFYGLSFLNKINLRSFGGIYRVFSLTDETYSLLTSSTELGGDQKLAFWVSLLNHVYWVLACSLGGIIGNLVKTEIKGLDFILTAMFAALAVEQIIRIRNYIYPVFALAISVFSLVMFPQQVLQIALVGTTAFIIFHSRSSLYES